jgi:hypothetical protein
MYSCFYTFYCISFKLFYIALSKQRYMSYIHKPMWFIGLGMSIYNQTSSVLASLTAQFKRMYQIKYLSCSYASRKSWPSCEIDGDAVRICANRTIFFPKKEIQTRLDAFSFWTRLNASKYMVKHLMRPTRPSNAFMERV